MPVEPVAGERWLQLTDGRLISIHRQVADQLVADGQAVEVPSERVEANEAGTGYRLLPEPEKKPAARAKKTSE